MAIIKPYIQENHSDLSAARAIVYGFTDRNKFLNDSFSSTLILFGNVIFLCISYKRRYG